MGNYGIIWASYLYYKMKNQIKTKRAKKPASHRKQINTTRSVRHKKAAKRANRRRNYPIHKRFLLHPIILFGLLCIGTFMGFWTYKAIADTLISSVIEAPPLQSGAIILSPTDGTIFTTTPIYVTGTCPAVSYVKLYQNGVFDGVSWCSAEGTFSIESSLFSGTNVFIAKDFNKTDLEGPVTSGISVIYNPIIAAGGGSPTIPPAQTGDNNTSTKSSTESSSSASGTPQPVLITSDFNFKTFSTGQTFTWDIDIEGGTQPYTLNIAWGDGTNSVVSSKSDWNYTLRHTFKSAGYYKVVVISEDGAGQQRVIQLAAAISAPKQPGFLSSINTAFKPKATNGLTSTEKWLLLSWPPYIIVVLMAASFWLGEREYSFIKLHRANTSRRS